MRSENKSIVVVGVGNPTRGDDAIGRLIAKALAAKQLPDIRVFESEGQATHLLEVLADAEEVILIDACQSGGAVGTIYRYEASQKPIPAAIGSVSSHGFGLVDALELARSFRQLPRCCVVFALEGEDFTHGAPLSAQVAAQFDELVTRVEQEIAHMRHEQSL